ncbi:Fpg/Nei family DNA glycosylase [Arthrobacter sp. GCM10027362]|uniref:Fpg/Nei family DNA glycosylase n=1 Tax=Arthrobacter sp. GCM10027362 TaxID=3273379 RepID=UPI00362874B0
MPEGDTVWRTARRLHAALAGRELLRTDFRVPRYATLDLSGRIVDEAVSRGKHLLIRTGDLTIHSHLKMEGSWQVYRPGERWRKPAFQARVVLETAAATAVGFQLGLLDVVPRAGEDEVVGHLGPDLLGPDWDEEEALRRLRLAPERPVGLALLDQRNLAGIGNIYRCEVCFLAGVHPLAPVGEVPDLPRLVRLSKRLLEANKDRGARSTTGGPAGRNAGYWAYGRAEDAFRRCGGPVVHTVLGNTELDQRDLYYCPHCQPGPTV